MNPLDKLAQAMRTAGNNISSTLEPAVPYTAGPVRPKNIPVKVYEESSSSLTKYVCPMDPKHAIDHKKGRMVLAERPDHAPNLIDEVGAKSDKPIRLIIFQHMSPGDILMLTAFIRDLHRRYPHRFITDVRVRGKGAGKGHTNSYELFDNNPNITPINIDDPDVLIWHAWYSAFISKSNILNTHFINAYHNCFQKLTGLQVPLTEGKPHIVLSQQEKEWGSRVNEVYKTPRPYWIIDAGRKNDITIKHWEFARFQQIVDAFPDMLFVQIGAANHHHPPLKGNNVLNEIGKTTVREFVRMMYHAYGVITPVSFPMHLSAAVESHPKYKYTHRPTIVIAGSREPSSWEAYSNQQYIHNCGMLPCSGQGGCWKSHVDKQFVREKKEAVYTNVVQTPSGQPLAKCMDMITVDRVIDLMKSYHQNFNPYAD